MDVFLLSGVPESRASTFAADQKQPVAFQLAVVEAKHAPQRVLAIYANFSLARFGENGI
jgi:hypothetical protein